MSPPHPGPLSTHVSLPAALTGNLSVTCFPGGPRPPLGAQEWGTEADSTAPAGSETESAFGPPEKLGDLRHTAEWTPGVRWGWGAPRAEKTPTSLLGDAKGNGMCQPETQARGQAPLGRSRLLPRALT